MTTEQLKKRCLYCFVIVIVIFSAWFIGLARNIESLKNRVQELEAQGK